MAEVSSVDALASALQGTPWMNWAASVQEENARLHREVALLNSALHQSLQSIGGSRATSIPKEMMEGIHGRPHLSLDTLLSCTSSTVATPETFTPPSSPASSCVSLPLDLPRHSEAVSTAVSPCASVLGDMHLVSSVAPSPCVVALADSLAPPGLYLSRIQPPLIDFRPPPGLPPPGWVLPSHGRALGVTMAQSISGHHVSAMPDQAVGSPDQAVVAKAIPLLPVAPENTACASIPMQTLKCATNCLSVHSCILDGAACTRVEWLVHDPQRKLRISCGFPLVSPAFDLEGCSLRVAFTAGHRWASEFNKTKFKQKKSTAQTRDLPPYGSLQLKTLGNLGLNDSAIRASFSVGRVQQGLLELTERTIQGVDLIADWRTELEGGERCDLRICVDFFRA